MQGTLLIQGCHSPVSVSGSCLVVPCSRPETAANTQKAIDTRRPTISPIFPKGRISRPPLPKESPTISPQRTRITVPIVLPAALLIFSLDAPTIAPPIIPPMPTITALPVTSVARSSPTVAPIIAQRTGPLVLKMTNSQPIPRANATITPLISRSVSIPIAAPAITTISTAIIATRILSMGRHFIGSCRWAAIS
jgi:hypothetical protein